MRPPITFPKKRSGMTSEELKKLFVRYSEDAQFEIWNKGRVQEVRFVYACQNGTIWKFTPKEWWQFVTKAVRNHGGHHLLLSKAMCNRPRHIIRGADNKFYSSNREMRCVNPLDWTVENWISELTRSEYSRDPSSPSTPPITELEVQRSPDSEGVRISTNATKLLAVKGARSGL
jgi:hypothetical protein